MLYIIGLIAVGVMLIIQFLTRKTTSSFVTRLISGVILVLLALLMSMVSDTAAQDAELLNRAQIAKYCIIVVSTAPAVVLYLCMQKFFVKGVMIGSVKG